MNKISNEFIKEFLDYFFDNQEIEGVYVDEDSSEPFFMISGDIEPTSRIYPFTDITSFLGYNFSVCCGAAKIGIVFEDFDEVIKISLTGSLVQNKENNEDEDEDDQDFNFLINNFERDYIELGEEVREIVNEKIKPILLPHVYRFKYGNISVYTQNKIEFYDALSLENKKSIIIIDEQTIEENINCSIETDFVQQLISYYNLSIDDLSDLNFTDMRTSNYGFLPDGTPVINDWEGFWE